MKVLISGGSGFIGRALAYELKAHNYNLTILTRDKSNIKGLNNNVLEIIEYSDITSQSNQHKNYDVVINLAGASIGAGRWTKKRKDVILMSRLDSTRFIIDAINKKLLEPKLLINASAIGYYGNRGNELLDESSDKGVGFLSDVCQKWEDAASELNNPKIRLAHLRTGLVLGKGGALDKLILPYKLFAGGNMGSGKQWVSWIHIKDVAGIIRHIIENKDIEGPVNIVSPEAVQMKDLQKTIGKIMRRPYWLTAPAFALRLILGEMADIVLTSQKVTPDKLKKSGYKFLYPDLTKALTEAISQYRSK